MTISDFHVGTTWVSIKKDWFKCAEQFEEICKFLELPEDCYAIEFEVTADYGCWDANYKGKSMRGLEFRKKCQVE